MPSGDVYISQSVSSSTAKVNGARLDFTITVENRGTADVTLTRLVARFSDPNLPNGILFGLSGCSSGCSYSGIDLDWSGSQTISPGQNYTITASGGFIDLNPTPISFSPVTIRYADITQVDVTGPYTVGGKVSILLSP